MGMRLIGLTVTAALLPATALMAADMAPPPAGTARGWGNVPNVTLQPPAAPAGGWGAGGWQGGAVPVPPPGAMAPPPVGPAHAIGTGGQGYGAAYPGAHPGMPGGPGFGMAGRPVGPAIGQPGGPGRPGGWNGGGWNGGVRGGANGGGFALRRGARLPGTFLAPDYYITDWSSYGLYQPGFNANWVRYYDGAALIDRGGIVQDYRDRVNWGGRGPGSGRVGGPGDRAYAAGYGDGYDDGYDDGVDYAEDAVSYRGTWQHPPVRYGAGNGPGGVYPGSGYDHRAYGYPAYGAGGAQIYGAGGATVVVVQGAPAVTTTTTTVEETVSYAAARKRVWKAPARKVYRKPRCVCTWR